MDIIYDDQLGKLMEDILMKVAVQFSKREEAKALGILLRHSPGMILRNRIYVISEEAVRALRRARVKFAELSREGETRAREGVIAGERI